MAGSPDRLVRHVQNLLHSVGPQDRPTTQEIAVLEDRVRRLRASDRMDHVSLSTYVVGGSTTIVHSRVGGECVATEV